MTAYQVLRIDGDQITLAGKVEAHSADGAIRKHAETKKVAGSYVAVPSRSWKPTTVAVETQTVIRLNGGTA